MKVLVVEDDIGLAERLAKSLQVNHYQVELAANGDSGLALTRAFDYDLVLLDLNLPKLDGISFCQQLRAEGGDVPILLMTAENTAESKIAGLDAGADDYVTKPLDIGELLARMRALLRRGRVEVSSLLEWGPISLAPNSCEVFRDGDRLNLTQKEYALLELFLRHPHRILSIDALIDQLWTYDKIPSDNAVRTQIKGLRRKLKQVGVQGMIETVYGLGYRLTQAPFTETLNRSKPVLEEAGLEEAVLEDAILVEQLDVKQLEVKQLEVEEQLEVDQLETTAERSTRERAKGEPLTGKQPAENLSFEEEDTTLTGLAAVWRKHQHKYFNSINTLDSTALFLSSLLRQPSEQLPYALAEYTELVVQSQKIVHTLKGALGSFGFIQASQITQITQNIEQSFQDISDISSDRTEISKVALHALTQLPKLIDDLREALNQPVDTLFPAEDTLNPAENALIVEQLSDAAPITPYRWLIIDRDQPLIDHLVLQASIWNIQTVVVRSAEQAEKATAQFPPDVVLIDPTCLQTIDQGRELLHRLKTQWPSLPVIVVSARDKLSDRIKILHAVEDCLFLRKPVSAQQVIETVNRTFDKTHFITEAKILALDDDPLILDSLEQLLSPWKSQLTLLSDPTEFWQALELTLPDLIILDIEMPRVSGLDICQIIRHDPRLEQVPILFLSAHREAEVVHKVFEAGGDDYISKPLVETVLVARILNRLKRLRFLRQLAEIDSLTGISCRRQSVVLLNHLLRLAARQGKTVCLALLDLDHFKQINDHYGHETGDRVLKTFGNYLRQTFRSEDIVGRWGGEEFVVGLFDATQTVAAQRLDALRQTFCQHVFDGELLSEEPLSEGPLSEGSFVAEQLHTKSFQISFSAGISAYPADGKDLQSLYHAADQALFQAKAAGRSRVLTTKKM